MPGNQEGTHILGLVISFLCSLKKEKKKSLVPIPEQSKSLFINLPIEPGLMVFHILTHFLDEDENPPL